MKSSENYNQVLELKIADIMIVNIMKQAGVKEGLTVVFLG